MVAAPEVAAVLVTRGNVTYAIDEIITALPFLEAVVYDNGAGTIERLTNDERLGVGLTPDLSVYGRYAAIELATKPVIYVQDDDCLLPPKSIAALLAAYEPGHVVCNMPAPFREHYSDSALVGFGAVFDRDLPAQAFRRYSQWQNGYSVSGAPYDPAFLATDPHWDSTFRRCCDVIFTTLTPRILVDVPYSNFDYATGPDRMYRQETHVGERARMLDLARKVRDAG